jgi:hypothetical protein
LLAGAAGKAQSLRLAAERPDPLCPAGRNLRLVRPEEQPGIPLAASGRCVAIVGVKDVSEAGLEEASDRIAKLPDLAGVVLELESLPAPADPAFRLRIPYSIKKLSTQARVAAPSARIAFDLTAGLASGQTPEIPPEDLGPYADALVIRPGRGSVRVPSIRAVWILTPRGDASSAAGQALRALSGAGEAPAPVGLVGVLSDQGREISEADWKSLERLQAYWTNEVSRDAAPMEARRPDGSRVEVLRFFDSKTVSPVLFLPGDAAGAASIPLAGGPFATAAVENLETGAKRAFEVAGATSLSLDLSNGALAVALRPASRPEGETREQVRVGAARGLTAEEIVARERVWDAAQRERTRTFIAAMHTSLRFRIAEVNETFDLTIEGPFFFERGQPPDWAWSQFFLNGVKWKGRSLPKLPILQPEKVATLPLDIRLTEDYAYELEGEDTISGRRAYEISFTPKPIVGDKPVYHGTVWIDAETFALLRRDSVQDNLKGETLSNVQSEIYLPVPGRPDVVLPLQIKGQQVFSTAGRTTAIERDVRMDPVEVNPPDFAERRAAAYASDQQMIRDTAAGMRYLIPDPAKPGERLVEERVSRKSTFGLVGGFYDGSVSYPIPLLGLQHFNFDLWQKGKQVSLFFGGALLTANYTDPALAGSRFDLGTDLFATAIAFEDVAYSNGEEVPGETIKHLPAVLSVNLGRPLGPYLKASVGYICNWDNYQRADDTAPDFVTPVDTFTNGALVRLVGNYQGFNATATVAYLSRAEWPFWGLPGNPDYSPDKKDYWKYSVTLSKDHYFKGFRKLHVGLAWRSGFDLDRFSKYEFGTFSGHPIRGYKNGSLRSQTSWEMNVSYGLNFENIIRFEGFYDQALLKDEESGFDNTYFSGAGLLASLNGPLKNSLIRAEVGVPVVGHGIHGVVVNVLLLKLF